MAKKNELAIEISARIGKLEQGLKKAQHDLNELVLKGRQVETEVGTAGGAAARGINLLQIAAAAALGAVIALGAGILRLAANGLQMAGSAEQVEIALARATGSAETAGQMMDIVSDMSEELGISYEELSGRAIQFANASRDANGTFDIGRWEQLLRITADLSAMRPDIPYAQMAEAVLGATRGELGQLEQLLGADVRALLGLEDAADSLAGAGGRLQGLVEIRAGQVGEVAGLSIQQLERLRTMVGAGGAAEEMAESFVGTADQIREEFNGVLRELGEELLPSVTIVLREFLDLFREHEDDIQSFVSNMGRLVTNAIANTDWDQVATNFERIAAALTLISNAGRPHSPEEEARINTEAAGLVEQATGGTIPAEQTNAFLEFMDRTFGPDVKSALDLQRNAQGAKEVNVTLTLAPGLTDLIQAHVEAGMSEVIGGSEGPTPSVRVNGGRRGGQ